MNDMFRYTRFTIILGMVFGIFFIPMVQGLSLFIPSPLPFRTTIWVFIAVYSSLLTAWAGGRLPRILFPLLLLFIFQFTGISRNGFLMLALLILGWVRCGSGFSGGMFKKMILEGIICLGGGLLTIGFNPGSPMTWALGVWLFFLVQSLYFLFFIHSAETVTRENGPASFESARKGAEKIISGL